MTTPSDHAERTLIRSALDETLVIEAAAGTGKTTELVRRMVAVLASGRTTVDRLVAVTFNEKAAGELKLRLRTELDQARRDAGREGASRLALERALARLEEARLGTIHGFCADLLRERSVEAEIDPEFKTLAEIESAKLFREAFTLWLQEKLEDPPEGVRRSLRRRSQAATDNGPVERLVKAGWTLAEWRDFPAPWRRDPFDRRGHLDALRRQLAEFAQLRARCTKPLGDNLYIDTQRAEQIDEAIRIQEAVRPRDYDGIEAAFVDLASDRKFTSARKGYGKSYGPETGREEVLAAHASLRTLLGTFASDADSDLAALLHGELLEAVSRYEALKQRTGRLDFVDLLVRTRNLLRDRADVRREYQTRFTHVFIDEFQDTDPLQAEILLLLAADDPSVTSWRDVRPVPGKLFVVGDPKQSIYRFRRADVGTYLEVKDLLCARGARCLHLVTSFRAVPAIQSIVNAAFAPLMWRDPTSHQADYVPLGHARQEEPKQPSVVVLPVPSPHGKRGGVTKTAIEASLPDAVGAFVMWLVDESGWTVTERERPGERVPIAARHVCLLFRRFDSLFAGDVARAYVAALEARGVRHLLVGGRSFHEREEVETVRTALVAIEWPDDELSVFATLRGPLFAIGDAELLEVRHHHRRLHPFRVPAELPDSLAPIRAALELLAGLHRGRNERPIAETITLLLEATRAHAAFALRPSGDQVLANVLHVAEQARRYEGTGGISFRGFVEQLLADAESGKTAEAPILEDGSDGVRIMTVHKAKGLEFPIVILADITASLAMRTASRFIDPGRGLCAMRIAGWLPSELIENEEIERQRELAEGLRLAYVAATRARDLLVLPAVGEGKGSYGFSSANASQSSWIAPLFDAAYPTRAQWARSAPSPGCPKFGKLSVLPGPDVVIEGVPACVAPGRHDLEGYAVTWWDPGVLQLDAKPVLGIRLEDLIDRDVPPELVRADLERHLAWQGVREATLERASQPALEVARATDVAAAAETRVGDLVRALELDGVPVQTVGIARVGRRPAGARFGSLVHAILAAVPLDADDATIERVARLHARILGCPAAEETAARVAIGQAIAHPLLQRAAEAGREGRLRRESAITLRVGDRALVDGVIDLAFLEGSTWTVVDFKTDRELARDSETYRRQVALYALAVRRATGLETSAVLMSV